MGYVGNPSTNIYASMDKQDITGNGGASYTLSHAVANGNEIEVFVNNVRQESGVAYTASGTTLNMTGNVASSDDFYVVYQGKAVGSIVPPDGSVGTAKLADGSVTATKLASGVQGVAGITTASTSGTAMSIDSSNRITTPARPVFVAHGSSSSWTDISDGSPAIIQLNTTSINVGGHWDTSNYKFTAPIAGVYQFHCNVYLKNNGGTLSDSGSYGYVNAKKNGVAVANQSIIHGYLNAPDADQNQTMSFLLNLAVNDYVQLSMQSSGGGTSSYSPAGTTFSGYLLG